MVSCVDALIAIRDNSILISYRDSNFTLSCARLRKIHSIRIIYWPETWLKRAIAAANTIWVDDYKAWTPPTPPEVPAAADGAAIK